MKKKKTYETITTEEMRHEVEDVEERMRSIEDDIFASPQETALYRMIKTLDTSERRLFIVYSQLNCSIIKTAKYFNVDRRTVSNRIKEIKDKILEDYGDATTTYQSDLYDSERITDAPVQVADGDIRHL